MDGPADGRGGKHRSLGHDRPASAVLVLTLYAVAAFDLDDTGREGLQLCQKLPRALHVTRIPSPLEFRDQLFEFRQQGREGLNCFDLPAFHDPPAMRTLVRPLLYTRSVIEMFEWPNNFIASSGEPHFVAHRARMSWNVKRFPPRRQ